jgi:hypothetical protein
MDPAGAERICRSQVPIDELFRQIPAGWSVMVFGGRRYGVTRTTVAGGRVQKLYAAELGGAAVVSANLYDGVRLQPCEMPAATVLAFVTGAIRTADRPSAVRTQPFR